jgi:hypothetical protein
MFRACSLVQKWPVFSTRLDLFVSVLFLPRQYLALLCVNDILSLLRLKERIGEGKLVIASAVSARKKLRLVEAAISSFLSI